MAGFRLLRFLPKVWLSPLGAPTSSARRLVLRLNEFNPKKAVKFPESCNPHRNQFKESQMIRRTWMFAATLALYFPVGQAIGQQYGPPSSGNTSAILFAPATLNLVAGLNGSGYAGDGGLANSANHHREHHHGDV